MAGSNDNEQMTPEEHYYVSVEQADNAYHLENNTNSGGEGDLFHAGDKDTFTPMWASEKMLNEMPEAELLYIREGSHAGIVEHPELINLRLDKFIRDHYAEFTETVAQKVG